jgi:hypothetical protein
LPRRDKLSSIGVMILLIVVILLVLAVVLLCLGSYLTNPFNKYTIVKQSFIIKSLHPLEIVDHTDRLRVTSSVLWRWLAIAKCGIHILHTRYISSPRSEAKTIPGIVADIHVLRFRPDKLLLISGDHFNGLFVRNLGVFYYPMLDRRIAGTAEDWQDRQLVYAQSVAYALGVFAKRPVPTTTIVETGPFSATPVNFYAYPSDTVYGILYALAALKGIEQAAPLDYASAEHPAETRELAELLLTTYASTTLALFTHYKQTVFDEATQLIRTDVHLSGAKDITRRQSAFFDNVIFWKTTQLAMRLGIIADDPQFLASLKTRIISTFWLPEKGYFLEDLSEEGKAGAYYSSDWLIVLATGFLDPASPKERAYFERSIEHIRAHKIDLPFPIKYQAETRAHRQFLAVRLAVASYGGDAIWSFWGMEYIKTLLLLHKNTGNQEYLKLADTHINSYEQAMLKNHGFPEVYDRDGALLQTPLYRSIRQTGWVIGFEQVQAMRRAATANEK